MTRKCKSCQMEINTKEKRCSHCGTDQRNWFGRYPLVTGILILVIIVGLIGGVHEISKSFSSSNQTQLEQSQPTAFIVQHDNSGTGTNTSEDTSIQGHMQHALQHIGL